MFKKTRYQYTCPDVINYRRNQYRLVGGSFALSILQIVVMWAGLEALNKKYIDPIDETIDTLNEAQE